MKLTLTPAQLDSIWGRSLQLVDAELVDGVVLVDVINAKNEYIGTGNVTEILAAVLKDGAYITNLETITDEVLDIVNEDKDEEDGEVVTFDYAGEKDYCYRTRTARIIEIHDDGFLGFDLDKNGLRHFKFAKMRNL